MTKIDQQEQAEAEALLEAAVAHVPESERPRLKEETLKLLQRYGRLMKVLEDCPRPAGTAGQSTKKRLRKMCNGTLTLFVFERSRLIAHWSPSSKHLPIAYFEAEGPFLTFEGATREVPPHEAPAAWRALKEGDMVSGWFWELPGANHGGPFGPFLTQAEAEADGRDWVYKIRDETILNVVAGADVHA
jgi:hypothetical protein